jgi:hypothetical protein
MLLADRGYDADWIGELAMKKGAWANIPPKSNRSDPICFIRQNFIPSLLSVGFLLHHWRRSSRKDPHLVR